MLSELSASIFYEWYDHYCEEPWGYEWEMIRHAELSTYLVNGLYHPKEPVKTTDFMRNIQPERKKKQSWRDMAVILKGLSDNG